MTTASTVSEVEALVRTQDRWRLTETINLIASENVMSRRARALLPSDFTHRYAEGHPGARYYRGTKYIDIVETQVGEALRKIFRCSRAEVRTISGTVANESVFAAMMKHDDLAIVNPLPAGGHISHQPIGAMGRMTRNILTFPYTADGWHMDAPRAKDLIRQKRPRMVVLGKSLILFREPVRELAEACRETGTVMMFDGAHVLGLIAAGEFQDPLAEGADFLTGSTHKTFFGPQRGVILSNAGDDLWKKVDKSAFPGSTSNHHLNTLPPLLVSAYEMIEFGGAYARQVIANARALGRALEKAGIPVEAREWNYTESHQIAVNVREFGGGGVVEDLLEHNDVIVNRNLLPNDPPKQVVNPSGLRLGTQEMTRVGMKEAEMEEIARLMHAAIAQKKDVRDDVHHFRARFQDVHFSFDKE